MKDLELKDSRIFEMDCEGCRHYQDMLRMKSGMSIGWYSTMPHPCSICKRFTAEKPDNYQSNDKGAYNPQTRY